MKEVDPTGQSRPLMHIAIFASHDGSLLQAIIDACESDTLAMEVVLVLSNNSDAKALTRSAEHNIASVHLSSCTHPEKAALDAAIVAQLKLSNVDWIVLAGYMKKLGPKTLSEYRNRILNTHPALLPKYGGQGYYGRKVHAAILEAGEKETGATVHIVEAEYDSGPILSQVKVPVKPGDTIQRLERRVKNAEKKLLVATLIELSQQRKAASY